VAEKKLKDNVLEKVAGGRLVFDHYECPVCFEHYRSNNMPKEEDIDGVRHLYCEKCKQWYKKSDWILKKRNVH